MACPECQVCSSCALQRWSIPYTAFWAASCKEKGEGSGFNSKREALSASKDHRPDISRGCQVTSNFLFLTRKHQNKCPEPSHRNCCMQCHIRESYLRITCGTSHHLHPDFLFSACLVHAINTKLVPWMWWLGLYPLSLLGVLVTLHTWSVTFPKACCSKFSHSSSSSLPWFLPTTLLSIIQPFCLWLDLCSKTHWCCSTVYLHRDHFTPVFVPCKISWYSVFPKSASPSLGAKPRLATSLQ